MWKFPESVHPFILNLLFNRAVSYGTSELEFRPSRIIRQVVLFVPSCGSYATSSLRRVLPLMWTGGPD